MLTAPTIIMTNHLYTEVLEGGGGYCNGVYIPGGDGVLCNLRWLFGDDKGQP